MKDFNIFSLLARYWWLILGVTALVFLASFFFYQQKPASSYGSISVTVRGEKVSSGASNVVLQTDDANAVQQLANTSQSWISDPAYAKKIIDQAGVSVTDSSIRGLAKVFKVVSSVSNSTSYEVEYTGKNADQVTQAFAALKDTLNSLKDQYNGQGETGLKMSFIFSDPIITNQSSSLPVVPFAGLAVGLVLAFILAAVLDQSRK